MVDGPVGLVIPFAAGMSRGLAVFQDIRTLSTDHLDFAPRLAGDIANRLQEAALFAAVEERSMAKARVAVARDLHDSIVQFLAGIGFRLEALIRSPADADEHAAGLAELKDMVLTEQRQMRAFIRGLKTGKPISVDELSRDCASLCQLLGRQWNVDCVFSNDMEPGWVMLRAQLEVQQLIREAVANAVRHGGATQVSVSLAGDDDRLCLTVGDNGCGFATPAAGLAITPPASLNARVREARGEIAITSRAGATAIVIQLPVGFAA
jgi:signal transduction histidine kinase